MSRRNDRESAAKGGNDVTLAEARNLLALSVPMAARLANVSEAKMYQAAASGEVESVRAFGRILICAAPFLAKFGVASEIGGDPGPPAARGHLRGRRSKDPR